MDAVIGGLAVLVVQQARASLDPRQFVCGIDVTRGSIIGLTAQDRRVMALISAISIECCSPQDRGAEIHELLYQCTQPLGDWLPETLLTGLGLERVCLINAEDGSPTKDAIELAREFSGISSAMEEQLFAEFRSLLDKNRQRADHIYTSVREFVVRHPLATETEIELLREREVLPSRAWQLLQGSFYEPVPSGWSEPQGVPICSHCRNALRKAESGDYRCRTKACQRSDAPSTDPSFQDPHGLYRVTRGLAEFWVEPGRDEVRLFDDLKLSGLEPRLYPHCDRVDIDVGDIGIDLKAYMSPELLGSKLSKSIGGLVHYPNKWLVVPDWLAMMVQDYVHRLRTALGERATALECMTASDARRRLTGA